MSIKIAIDGQLFDEHDAKISVLDRGFLYGDSVYEVIRTYHGRPFALDQHLRRLERSAELLGMPGAADHVRSHAEVETVVAAAQNPESYIRLIVTRGSGPIQLDPAVASTPRRVIIVAPLSLLDPEVYESGVAISLVHGGRAAGGAVPLGAKSGNYLVNVMAVGAARRKGAHEAVLLDAEGRIAEGASSNIFVVGHDGRLRTPPLSVGILEGITRRKVIAIAREQGLGCEEVDLRPDDLFAAAEVFLTSTLREVLPVTKVDETQIHAGSPGPITRRLHAAFRAAIPAPDVG